MADIWTVIFEAVVAITAVSALILGILNRKWRIDMEKRRELIEVVDTILADMKKYVDKGLRSNDSIQIIWGLQLFTRHWKQHKDSSDSKSVPSELEVEEYYNLLLKFESKLPKDKNGNLSISSLEELTLEQRELLKKIREDGKKLSDKIDKITDVKKIS